MTCAAPLIRVRTVPSVSRRSSARQSPVVGGMPEWAMRLAEQHRVQFSDAHADGEDEAGKGSSDT